MTDPQFDWSQFNLAYGEEPYPEFPRNLDRCVEEIIEKALADGLAFGEAFRPSIVKFTRDQMLVLLWAMFNRGRELA